MTWSYRVALGLAVALVVAGFLTGSCASVQRVYSQADAYDTSKLCFYNKGQEVRAAQVPCPDEAEYAKESAFWLKRMNESHPFYLSGTRLIFTKGQIRCVACSDGKAVGLTDWTQGKATAYVDATQEALFIPGGMAPTYYETVGHEFCHLAGSLYHINTTHSYIMDLSGNKRFTPRDRWFFGVCSSAGSGEPRLPKPFTSGAYP